MHPARRRGRSGLEGFGAGSLSARNLMIWRGLAEEPHGGHEIVHVLASGASDKSKPVMVPVK